MQMVIYSIWDLVVQRMSWVLPDGLIYHWFAWSTCKWLCWSWSLGFDFGCWWLLLFQNAGEALFGEFHAASQGILRSRFSLWFAWWWPGVLYCTFGWVSFSWCSCIADALYFGSWSRSSSGALYFGCMWRLGVEALDLAVLCRLVTSFRTSLFTPTFTIRWHEAWFTFIHLPWALALLLFSITIVPFSNCCLLLLWDSSWCFWMGHLLSIFLSFVWDHGVIHLVGLRLRCVSFRFSFLIFWSWQIELNRIILNHAFVIVFFWLLIPCFPWIRRWFRYSLKQLVLLHNLRRKVRLQMRIQILIWLIRFH